MNRAMYTLSIVAAIFLPLGLLTGLLGINVGGIPGTENKWAFTLVVVILIATAIGLLVWFKKIMWLQCPSIIKGHHAAMNVHSDLSNGKRGLTVKVNAFLICLAIQYIGVMGSGINPVLSPTYL